MKDDLISRQAAIDGKISIQRANGVEIYSDEAVPVEYLKALPSAQPEKCHWIPCRKQLPFNGQTVLVCTKDGEISDGYFVSSDWGSWECGLGELPLDDDEIIAWMPLPEPYRSDEVEGDRHGSAEL